jgi:hypothetical protein
MSRWITRIKVLRKTNRAFLNVQPDIYPQKGISQLLLKASLALLQPVQQPTGEIK